MFWIVVVFYESWIVVLCLDCFWLFMEVYCLSLLCVCGPQKLFMKKYICYIIFWLQTYYAHMYFNIICKFYDNVWCVRKLDNVTHVDLNQMNKPKILTIPKTTGASTTLNLIPNNCHEFEKINWIVHRSSRFFLKNSKPYPKG
jgi:hypothetical protein